MGRIPVSCAQKPHGMADAHVEQRLHLYGRREPGLTGPLTPGPHTLRRLAASPGELPPAHCSVSQGCPCIRLYISKPGSGLSKSSGPATRQAEPLLSQEVNLSLSQSHEVGK